MNAQNPVIDAADGATNENIYERQLAANLRRRQESLEAEQKRVVEERARMTAARAKVLARYRNGANAKKRETVELARGMGWKGKTVAGAQAFFQRLERERRAANA